MTQSAIERELLGFVQSIGAWVRRHDRGVVIGITLSVIPVPIVSFAGLLVGLFNLTLLKSGKLDKSETQGIATGIVLSLICTAGSAFVFCYVYGRISSMGWSTSSGLMTSMYEHLLALISQIYSIVVPAQTGIGI